MGKRRDAEEVGIRSIHHELPASITQPQLEALIATLGDDPGVHGILVQLPLPDGLDSDAIIEQIDPAKDVDGLDPFNLGLLVLNRPGLRPCTPSGVMRLLEHYSLDTAGRRAVVRLAGRCWWTPTRSDAGARGVRGRDRHPFTEPPISLPSPGKPTSW